MYEIFDGDMIQRIKLVLSVQANVMDEGMGLHAYARFILKNKRAPSY